MSERKETCRSCRFRDPDTRPDYEGAGECRRYPPKVSVTADSVGDAFYHRDWPWMHAGEWCGEYQPLLQERNQ